MHRPAPPPPRFAGFSRESLELLRQLQANNNRPWFQAHRQLVADLLLRPAEGLVLELGPRLRDRISPGLRAEPRVDGSILRLQHDARFHRGAPYRTHIELWFWEGPGASHQHPGLFVRLAAEELVLGAGITLFPPGLLLRYRALVDEPASGRELAGILSRLTASGMRVTGACLRRVPAPYPRDHERAALMRQIGLKVERSERLPEPVPESVLGPVLPDLLVSGLVRLRPFHAWLRRLE
jgi:uncharacterized protein (TIGR02453 family)